jgi:hypothetical protein
VVELDDGPGSDSSRVIVTRLAETIVLETHRCADKDKYELDFVELSLTNARDVVASLQAALGDDHGPVVVEGAKLEDPAESRK